MHFATGGEGRPVVFIHGSYPSFAQTLLTEEFEWDDWHRALADHFRLVTYDRRGCGQSSCPPEGYELSNQANDVVGLLDYLDIPSASIIGVSAGGPIAMAVGAGFPKRVERLVLADTAVDLFREGDPTGAAPVIREAIRDLEKFGAEYAFDHRPALATVWLEPLWMTQETNERGDSAAFWAREEQLAAQAKSEPTATRVLYYSAELQSLRAYTDCDGREFARGIRAPTLILHGERDRVVPMDWAAELEALIQGSKLETVSGGNHGVLWRSPVARERVIQFLSG
jgi:pimeloyl-ACP methyl ester carboxylesterase